MQFDSENKNSKWYDAIKLEMESMLEYKVFKKWDKTILDKHMKVMNPPIEEDEQIPGVEDDHAQENAVPQDEPATEAECFKQAEDSSISEHWIMMTAVLNENDGQPMTQHMNTFMQSLMIWTQRMLLPS